MKSVMNVTAKVVIYETFVEGRLEAPKHLARTVHDLYFEPKYEEFRPRTLGVSPTGSLSTFKELEPIDNSKLPQNWVSSWRLGSPSRPRHGLSRFRWTPESNL